MKKGPCESCEYEEVKIVKFQNLETCKEYVVAEDTVLYVGPENRPAAVLKLPKGTSFGILKPVLSTIHICLKNNVNFEFGVGELNTDEIKVLEK